MTRLIVEEGNTRRAYRLQEGRMTVGSGPDATLRLTSGDVADVHVDLEVAGGRVRLSARPGVLTPRVNGVPAAGTVELAHGVRVALGSSVLVVEYEDALAAAAAPAPGPLAGGVTRKPVSSARRKSAVSGTRARELHSGGRGVPAWLVVTMILGVVGLGAWLVPKIISSKVKSSQGDMATILHAQEDLKAGSIEKAEKSLTSLTYAELDPKVRARYDEVRAGIAAFQAEIDLNLENMAGTEYLQTQLQNFESNYLAGKAERPRVRVFLKRCAEFKQRWPKHPELDWVQRMETRFGAIVNLNDPPNYEDIAFEVKALTWANPRDYGQAMALLTRFADEEASFDDRAKALALLDELTTQRAEWFVDRMQQARYEFDREQEGKSVAWLVMLIVYTGDDTMADQAAEQLVKFAGLPEWLRGYQRTQPEKYAIMKRRPVIAAYIRDNEVE